MRLTTQLDLVSSLMTFGATTALPRITLWRHPDLAFTFSKKTLLSTRRTVKTNIIHLGGQFQDQN